MTHTMDMGSMPTQEMITPSPSAPSPWQVLLSEQQSTRDNPLTDTIHMGGAPEAGPLNGKAYGVGHSRPTLCFRWVEGTLVQL